jgi:hypothetical protein
VALPAPTSAVVALATFVRERLGEVGDTLSPLWRRDGVEVLPATEREGAVALAAKQFATAVVGAAAPFAPTSYARTRLLRQLHASGLLTDDELRRTTTVIDVASPGASR